MNKRQIQRPANGKTALTLKISASVNNDIERRLALHDSMRRKKNRISYVDDSLVTPLPLDGSPIRGLV